MRQQRRSYTYKVKNMKPDLIIAAMAERDAAIKEFNTLIEAGRIHPISYAIMGRNLVRYNEANQKLYEAMWMAVADTGVKMVAD